MSMVDRRRVKGIKLFHCFIEYTMATIVNKISCKKSKHLCMLYYILFQNIDGMYLGLINGFNLKIKFSKIKL